MHQLWLPTVCLLVSYIAFAAIFRLRCNIASARRTGLPYIVTPALPTNIFWLATYQFWLPIIKRFPKSWWEKWLSLITPDDVSRRRYDVFRNVGDTFLLVSPSTLCLMTANAECIRQITSLPERYPKPVEEYEVLRQFGENVITADGAIWRTHRKATSAAFNERSASLVFRQTIHQTESLVKHWKKCSPVRAIETVEQDTLRLALHIICYVGFGVCLSWPDETMPSKSVANGTRFASQQLSSGHDMSLMESAEIIMENITVLLAIPKQILKMMPFKKIRRATLAYHEFELYLNELLDEKIEHRQKGDQLAEGMDLMGMLVRCNYTTDGGDVQQRDEKSSKQPSLSKEDILGNAFVLLIAGHETIANALHFAIIQLAANPRSQRRLQKDLDHLLGGLHPNSWDYSHHMNPLLGGMPGAVMNETLRLYPPLTKTTKRVTHKEDQIITIDEEKHIIPKGISIGLASGSAHCNPRYWPSSPSKISVGKDDLEDFVPERWLQRTPACKATMLRPEKGAYTPFSDGPRACLGRRFAQVEVIAALAVIFQQYSVELVCDVPREQLGNMERSDLQKLYNSAQGECRKRISKAFTIITLGLHGTEAVAVQLVKRGEEKFVDWMDAE